LLEHEESTSAKRDLRNILGWWGRGYVEGAISWQEVVDDEKMRKAANDFGLTVDTVAAHLTGYCYKHQEKTPVDAVQNLTLKIQHLAQ